MQKPYCVENNIKMELLDIFYVIIYQTGDEVKKIQKKKKSGEGETVNCIGTFAALCDCAEYHIR